MRSVDMTASRTSGVGAHSQFVPASVHEYSQHSSLYSAGKNLVLERQREYQVGLTLVFFPYSYSPVCSLLQNSHKPIYYRPPRSRLYLGTHAFFLCSSDDVLTGVSGVYKTGFTLGVVGIAYSAY